MLRASIVFVFVLLVPLAVAQETPNPASCPEGQQLTEIETGVFACKPVPGYVPPEQPPEEGRRFLYTGYAEIEQLTFEEIKTRLETQGCGTQGTIDGCFYEERMIVTEPSGSGGRAVPVGDKIEQEKKGIGVLVVHPTGASFGPTDFALTETRLYASRDIEGPRDDETFKSAVEAEVAGLGGFVTLKRETWTVTARDSTGIAYASGGGSDLLSFIESVEGRGASRGQSTWIISVALLVLAGFVWLAYKKLR